MAHFYLTVTKPIELVKITEEQVLSDWVNKGYDEDFVHHFIIGMGKTPPKEVYTVSPAVELITGKPARTFSSWVNDNKENL